MIHADHTIERSKYWLCCFLAVFVIDAYAQLSTPKNRCRACLPLSTVQQRFDTDPATGERIRRGYTLEEFLNLDFTPDFDPSGIGNLECIVGYYSQYVLGEREDLPVTDPNRWFILISHPKTHEDMEGDNIRSRDRVPALTSLLRSMCYDKNIEDGWISLANWQRLVERIPESQTLALRMTNANFSERGRIVKNGEYLTGESLRFLNLMNTFRKIRDAGRDFVRGTELYGPNFPAPGYFGGIFSKLKSMEQDQWSQDQRENITYFQDVSQRSPYRVTYTDGNIIDRDGEPIDIRDLDIGLYSLDCMGRLYVATRNQVTYHSQFMAGAAVAATGDLYVDNGDPTHLNLGSGHYKPPGEFLPNIINLLQPKEFEEQYRNEFLRADQAWHCFDRLRLAPLDGSATTSFGPPEPLQGQWLWPRRIPMPTEIPVTIGSATDGSMIELFVKTYNRQDGIPINQERTIQYLPNPSDRTKYFLDPGVTDEFLLFSFIEIRVVNGPTMGVAELRLDNCPGNGSVPSAESTAVTTSVDATPSLLLEVYPNPTSDRFQISRKDARGWTSGTTLRMWNMQGLVVREWEIKSLDKVEVSVVDLPAGLYVLDIVGRSTTTSYPIVVQK